MSQPSLVSQWQKQFVDPYALLGISVAADERRISKRYRQVAKFLHPDSYQSGDTHKELAKDIFAQLISPAYHQIGQAKGRSESLALLRLRLRSLVNKQGGLTATTPTASQLLTLPAADMEVFYEQAIASLADTQYDVLEQFDQVTAQLVELNRAYLYVKHLKADTPVIRERRTGLIATTDVKPIEFTPVEPDQEPPSINYARRHFERAQGYMDKNLWLQAIQELRDAIKLEANQSEYHALIAVAYLNQNLVGMATVHFRQALKLNPQDELALQYASKLKIALVPQPDRNQHSSKRSGLFGLFGSKT